MTLQQQNTTSMVLDFASFFLCSIRPFMHASQKKAVCTLLTGKPEGYSDAVCSNYIRGKRAIPDDSRVEIAALTDEEMQARLEVLEIFDLQPPADALMHLVEHSQLQKSTLNRLNKSYKTSTPLSFITEVFRVSSSAKDTHQISTAERSILQSFAAPISPASDKEPEDDPDPDVVSEEDMQWLQEYLPQKFRITSNTFFGTPVAIQRQTLSLPSDYPALVLLLKPALNGMPIDTFTFEDFTDLTTINPATGKIRKGKLTCLKLVGQIEGIDSAIRGQNLTEVSDIIMLMKGRITLTDARKIETACKAASNKNVRFIRALNFDSRLSDIEVTLILRTDPEAVFIQTNGPCDDSDMKIVRR